MADLVYLYTSASNGFHSNNSSTAWEEPVTTAGAYTFTSTELSNAGFNTGDDIMVYAIGNHTSNSASSISSRVRLSLAGTTIALSQIEPRAASEASSPFAFMAIVENWNGSDSIALEHQAANNKTSLCNPIGMLAIPLDQFAAGDCKWDHVTHTNYTPTNTSAGKDVAATISFTDTTDELEDWIIFYGNQLAHTDVSCRSQGGFTLDMAGMNLSTLAANAAEYRYSQDAQEDHYIAGVGWVYLDFNTATSTKIWASGYTPSGNPTNADVDYTAIVAIRASAFADHGRHNTGTGFNIGTTFASDTASELDFSAVTTNDEVFCFQSSRVDHGDENRKYIQGRLIVNGNSQGNTLQGSQVDDGDSQVQINWMFKPIATGSKDCFVEYSVDDATPTPTALGRTGVWFTTELAAGGTTYFQTPSMTATGTAATLGLLKSFKRTLTPDGTGTATLNRLATLARSFSASGTGTASLTRLSSFFRTLSFSGVGTAALTKGKQFGKLLSHAASGAVSLVRNTLFARTLSHAATGTSSLTRLASYLRTLTHSATGASALTKVASFLKTLSHTASGAVSLTRQAAYERLLSMTATGAAALTKTKVKLIVLASTAVGTASVTLQKSLSKLLAISASGAAALTKTGTFARTFTASAVGSAALTMQKAFERVLNVAATGSAALRRQIRKTLQATVVAVVSLAKSTGDLIEAAMTAFGSAALRIQVRFNKSTTATGTASLSKGFFETFTATALGTATLSKIKVKLMTLAASATGSASLTKASTFVRTLSFTATGTAVFSRTAQFLRTLAHAATGGVVFDKTFLPGTTGLPVSGFANTSFYGEPTVLAGGSAALLVAALANASILGEPSITASGAAELLVAAFTNTNYLGSVSLLGSGGVTLLTDTLLNTSLINGIDISASGSAALAVEALANSSALGTVELYNRELFVEAFANTSVLGLINILAGSRITPVDGFANSQAFGDVTLAANGAGAIGLYSFQNISQLGLVWIYESGTTSLATRTITVDQRPAATTNLPVTGAYPGFEPTLDSSSNSVFKNDSDPDGDPLSATVAVSPDFGTLLDFYADGSFALAPPDQIWTGTITWEYNLWAGGEQSDTTGVVQVVFTDAAAFIGQATGATSEAATGLLPGGIQPNFGGQPANPAESKTLANIIPLDIRGHIMQPVGAESSVANLKPSFIGEGQTGFIASPETAVSEAGRRRPRPIMGHIFPTGGRAVVDPMSEREDGPDPIFPILVDYEDWTWDGGPDNIWGGEVLALKERAPILISGYEMYQADRGNSFGSRPIYSVLERIGLPLGYDREGQPYIDPRSVKFIRGIYPIFDAVKGTTLTISLGGQDNVEEGVTWADPTEFVVGVDEYLPFTVSGKYLSIRVESTGMPNWVLTTIVYDLEIIGMV